MIKRHGKVPEAGRRYIMRPSVYAILPRGRDLLLTFQAEPWPEIQLPGGGIDKGEHPIAALHREVFEETGWRIASPRRLGAFRRFTYMPEYDLWAEKLCHIYIAHPVRPHGPPTEVGHTALWMAAAEAAETLANSGDREFVALLQGKGRP
jgi:8-oxo-dGTP diphosphatase